MPRSQPKYQRLQEQLAQRISSGEWRPGARLPSEMQIAEDYGVAYLTVRSAISELVREGLLRRIRGRGTFVVEPDGPDRRPSVALLLTPNWHSMDPFYFPPIVTGFVSKAESLGYHVHLADRSEPLLEFLKFRELHIGAAACVILDHADLLDADALLDRGVMVVAINHYGGGRRIPSVSPDNQKGSYDATRWLIEIGHRDFAFLAGPRSNLDATERRRGVQLAIQDAGLPASGLTVLEGLFVEESGYERAKAILNMRTLPTAVVCVSDLAAIGLLKAFAEAGVRVPEDVSVLGFGDFRLAGYVHPALTTVKLPLEEVGSRAADALIEQFRGVLPPSVLLGCPLVERQSVCPPKSRR